MALKWNSAEEQRLLKATSGPTGRYIAGVAAKVASAAARHCPVGTPESTGKPGYAGGRLRGSINWRVTHDKGEMCGEVSAGTAYFRFVHDGTRRMAARPFLVQGLRDVTGSSGGWSPWSDK